MATYNLNVTASVDLLGSDISGSQSTDFAIANPLPASSYFTFETVRNSDGFYDTSSPKNMAGTYTLGAGLAGLVKSDYIASVVVEPGGGTLTFIPDNYISGSSLNLRGTTSPPAPTGTDFDVDAQAFFDRVTTAGGTLSLTEQDAVNTLVVQMKADGIWSKMKAIYPMVGASAAACAQNLKSSSFTGTFYGGVTFASTGVKFNGTTGYLDTSFVASNQFGAGNGSISVYSRLGGSRNADFGRYTGGSNAIIGYLNISGNIASWFGDNNFTQVSDPNNGLGLYNFQRTSTSNINVFANATKSLNASTTFLGWPNLSIPIGAYFFNTSFSQSSGREFAFAHLGDALTDTEASDFYTAVQAFQTTLNRQV